MLNDPGKGFNLLDAPYDVKVVGDYTGLTNPRRGGGGQGGNGTTGIPVKD